MPLDRIMFVRVKLLAHQGQPKEDDFREAHSQHAKEVVEEAMKRSDFFQVGYLDWWVREKVSTSDRQKAFEWQILHEVARHINSVAHDRFKIIMKENGPKYFFEPGYTIDVSYVEGKRFRVVLYRMTEC